MINESTISQFLPCYLSVETIEADSIEAIYYSEIEYPALDDFDSVLEEAEIKEEYHFSISLEPILPAPGEYYFQINGCKITKNLQIDDRLRDVISIYFQLISDDERVFFLVEQVLCPDPLETDGRYFELFGQLFALYDIEQTIEAHNLIDRDGYATLAYVLSEDDDQLFPVLTNIH